MLILGALEPARRRCCWRWCAIYSFVQPRTWSIHPSGVPVVRLGAAAATALADWLVDALNEQYDVSRKIGQASVDADQVLPLLDGLDEVALEYRAACVEAINTFRQDHGLLPLVVCSRVTDYEALGTRLRLQGAVATQPLTHAQVDSYLAQIGPPLAAVRQALEDDPLLWELLNTPLMLTIMTSAYAGRPGAALSSDEAPLVRWRHLFDDYIESMFQRRSVPTRYNQSGLYAGWRG